MVDATSSHDLLSFMNTFFEYNQIQMAPKVKKKIAFITDWDLFYYRVISFDLKNVGATYQYLVNKIFKDQIGQNLELYMDDKLKKLKSLGPILTSSKKTLPSCKSTKWSWTTLSVSLGWLQRSFLVSWSLTREWRQTLRKSKLSSKWALWGWSKMSNTL